MYCLIFGKSWRIDRQLFVVTFLFGLILMIIGSYFESNLNYLAVWMYIIGGFVFIFGLIIFMLTEEEDLFKEILFLISNIGMIYASITPQKIILMLYATIGISFYIIKSFFTLKFTLNISNSAIYIRYAFSLMLLLLSIERYQKETFDGFVEFVCGFSLLILYTFSWLVHIQNLNEIKYRSISFTIHLSSAILIVGLSRTMNHMFYKILISIDTDCGTLTSTLGGIILIIDHSSALLLDFKKPSLSPWITSRALVILMIGFLSFAIETPIFATSTVSSLLFLIWIELVYKSPNLKKHKIIIISNWFIALICYLFTIGFDLYYLEWPAYATLVLISNLALSHIKHAFIFFTLVFSSISLILDSKILYLTTLAFLTLGTFKLYKNKKQKAYLLISISSLSFLVYFYWNYDYYHLLEIGNFYNLKNSFNLIPNSFYKKFLVSQWFPIHNLLILIRLPVEMESVSDYVLLCIVAIGIVTILGEIFNKLSRQQINGIDESIPPKMIITEMTIYFPKDTNQNGIVIGLSGEKPQTFEIENASLCFFSDGLWNTLASIFNENDVNNFKSLHYPIKLFPHKMSKKNFNSTSNQKIWVHFGTGFLKEKAFPQNQIRSMLRKLVNYGDQPIIIRVLYKSKKIVPCEGVLFEFEITPGSILNSIKEQNLELQPLLKNWI